MNYSPRCKVCGEAFPARAVTQCLCSPECRREQKRRVCRRWYAANTAYQIKRVLLRRKRRRASRPDA